MEDASDARGIEEEDFAGYVRARYPALVRYGASLVGDAARAEDLVQMALLKVSRAWGRIDPERRDSYTRTVMARQAWRLARRRWNGEVATARLPEPPSIDDFAAVDSGDSLRRALDRLPVRQRVVLTLRYVDDLSEREVAAALSCSVGTVKSRSARAIETLRRSGLVSDGERSFPASREGGGR